MMKPSEFEKHRREMRAIEGVMRECEEDIWKLAKKHGSPSDFELFVDVERICDAMSDWSVDSKEPEVLCDALARLRKDLRGRADALDVVDQRAYCMEQALDAWLALPREVTDEYRVKPSAWDIDKVMSGIPSKSRDRIKVMKRVLEEFGTPWLSFEEIVVHCSTEGISEEEAKAALNSLCNNAEAIREGDAY